jgi:hypothetical protein
MATLSDHVGLWANQGMKIVRTVVTYVNTSTDMYPRSPYHYFTGSAAASEERRARRTALEHMVEYNVTQFLSFEDIEKTAFVCKRWFNFSRK